ncbi:hypothetical protein AT251_09485 [Enterovibrio nigricans]|nr:hypothetical protein AT251_09485 [Enterovibrio nigricans]
MFTSSMTAYATKHGFAQNAYLSQFRGAIRELWSRSYQPVLPNNEKCAWRLWRTTTRRFRVSALNPNANSFQHLLFSGLLLPNGVKKMLVN